MVVLRRDSWLCRPCQQAGRITQATEVDHVVPKALGGTDAESNLQSICRRCHASKSAREGNLAGMPGATPRTGG
jgi:5-methylcytosine-specific restriction protein A